MRRTLHDRRHFDSDYARFRAAGIEFTEGPWEESYGKVAVFKDLYGNRIDLIEPRTQDEAAVR